MQWLLLMWSTGARHSRHSGSRRRTEQALSAPASVAEAPDPVAAVPRPESTRSVVGVHGVVNPQRVRPSGIGDKPGSPALAGRLFTPEPPGKPRGPGV